MSAQLDLTISSLLQRSATLGSGTVSYNPQTLFQDSVANGSGVDQIEEGTTISSSIVSGAPKEWDLYGSGAGDYDVAGIEDTSIVFTAIKSIIVVNANTTAGQTLIIGGAAATAWEAPFNSVAGAKIEVPPKGCLVLWAPDAGWTVDNTHKLLKIDAAAGTVAFTMQITGTLS